MESVEKQCTAKCEERKQVGGDEDHGKGLDQARYTPNRYPTPDRGSRDCYALGFFLFSDRSRLTDS